MLVVEIKASGETKIFYKSLLSLELKQLIEGRPQTKTKSIRLRPLDETTLYKVCRKFLVEKKFQPRVLLERKANNLDFKNFTLTSLTFDLSDPKTSNIFDHDFTMYGTDSTDLRHPLSINRITALTKKDIIKIDVNNNSYDLYSEITFEDDRLTIQLEKDVKIIISENANIFRLEFIGFTSLSSQLRVVPFLKDLLISKKIEFNDNVFQFNDDFKVDFDYEEYQVFLNHTKDVFELLGIPEDTIFEEQEDEDIESQLRSLIETVHSNKLTRISIVDPHLVRFINLRIGNQTISLFYEPDSGMILKNAFSQTMLDQEVLIQYDQQKDRNEHSVYALLNEKFLMSINFDSKIVKQSFDMIDPFTNNDVFNTTNHFCLSCIRAYDICKNGELLSIAIHIYDKYIAALGSIEEYSGNDSVVLVNMLQVKKRQQNLNFDDKQILYRLRRQAVRSDNHELLFCVNILLDYVDEAQFAYNLMSIEQQQQYKDMPIFMLFHLMT